MFSKPTVRSVSIHLVSHRDWSYPSKYVNRLGAVNVSSLWCHCLYCNFTNYREGLFYRL